MVLILMGVSGSGKTAIGQLLAQAVHWPFYDGDDFHPRANVAKMARGIALTDADRAPWLQSIHLHIAALVTRSESAVVACSALKQTYRTQLVGELEDVYFIYLQGGADLIQQRLMARRGHFMPPELLASQFDTLEEPEEVLTIDIAQLPDRIVSYIRRAFVL